MRPYSKVLHSADDSPIAVLGTGIFNIEFGNKLIQHPCLVANITNEGLLGMDFLKSHQMKIDFSSHQVTCEGEVITARCHEGHERSCRVTVSEHVTIPAGTRTIIQAKTRRPLADGAWMVEPLSHTPGHLPVVTGRTLVSMCGTRLPVEIMNPTEDDVTLYQHTNLGIIHRVPEDDLICSLNSQESTPSQEQPKTTELPPEVQHIMNEIEIPMDGRQRQQVQNLLQNNLDIFATDKEPFGRTDLVQHEITTTTE